MAESKLELEDNSYYLIKSSNGYEIGLYIKDAIVYEYKKEMMLLTKSLQYVLGSGRQYIILYNDFVEYIINKIIPTNPDYYYYQSSISTPRQTRLRFKNNSDEFIDINGDTDIKVLLQNSSFFKPDYVFNLIGTNNNYIAIKSLSSIVKKVELPSSELTEDLIKSNTYLSSYITWINSLKKNNLSFNKYKKDIFSGLFISKYKLSEHKICLDVNLDSMLDNITTYYEYASHIKNTYSYNEDLVLYKNLALSEYFNYDTLTIGNKIPFYLPTSTTYDYKFADKEWFGQVIFLINVPKETYYIPIGEIEPIKTVDASCSEVKLNGSGNKLDQKEITLAPGIFTITDIKITKSTEYDKVNKIVVIGAYEDFYSTDINTTITKIRGIITDGVLCRGDSGSGGRSVFNKYNYNYYDKYLKYKNKYLKLKNT
jgi:hypothetical protein